MATEQEITVQAAGLFDSGNNPYALPPGALLVASDVDITRDNVLQGRRGMARAIATQFSLLKNFQTYVIGRLFGGATFYRSQSPFTTWTAYDNTTGAPTPPNGFVETAKSLFGNVSSGGLVRWDSPTATAQVVAGLPSAYGISAVVGGAGTAVVGQTRVAYRSVYGRRDVNSRLILGSPSGRCVFTNTNASTTTNDVALSVPIPHGTYGLNTADFVQVYRTAGTVDIAETSDPGDECYLVAEVAVPAPATITSWTRVGTTVTATTSAPHGFVQGQHVFIETGSFDFPLGTKPVATVPDTTHFTYTEAGAAVTYSAVTSVVYPASILITDSQPLGAVGAALYTNPTQETILNQNARPFGSNSGAIAEFGGCLWIGSPYMQKTITVTMVSVPAAGSVISTLGTYSAGAAEDTVTKTFQRFTSGTPYENIRDTTASLVRVFNLCNVNQLNPNIYAASDSTLVAPGKITFFGLSTLVLTQTAPFLSGGKSTLTVPTSELLVVNGLIYSKPNQPDHVSQALASAPLRVGSDSEEVKKLVPTRSALFVLKNDGVWKVTGSNGEFQVTALDPTTSIMAAESALALDNNVYCLTDQGVARISESGVEVISRPIEQTIRDHFDSTSIASASEADHKYRLWCGTRCVVFDPWTKTWTERSEPFLDSTITAVLNERTTGRLLVSGTSTVGARTGTYVENVSTLGDSLGETVVISTSDEATTQNTYNVTHAASTLVVGDTLELSTCSAEVIQATDSTHSIVLATELPAAGTYAIYRKTGARTVSWQIRPSTPGTLNEWQELVFHFLANVGQRATVNTATDFVTSGATNIDLDLIQTRLTNGDGFNQIRVWPAREDSLSAVLVATLSWASSRADIRLSGLTTRFAPSSWQVSR